MLNKMKARVMAGECAGAQTTTEYAIVVAIVLGVTVALVAFRDTLSDAIKNAANGVQKLFTNLSTSI